MTLTPSATLAQNDCAVEQSQKCLRINSSYFILQLLYDVILDR
jgi:hypothetical protein